MYVYLGLGGLLWNTPFSSLTTRGWSEIVGTPGMCMIPARALRAEAIVLYCNPLSYKEVRYASTSSIAGEVGLVCLVAQNGPHPRKTESY